jgi:hypothetical protein
MYEGTFAPALKVKKNSYKEDEQLDRGKPFHSFFCGRIIAEPGGTEYLAHNEAHLSQKASEERDFNEGVALQMPFCAAMLRL